MTKRILSVMMCAIALVFAACSSPGTPGEALKGYVEDFYAGNPEAVYDNLDYTGASPEDVERTKQMFAGMWDEKVKPQLEKMGGLKSVEILSEQVADDGNSAVVKMRLTFGNGEVEEEEQKLVLVDGKWLLSIEM